MWPNQVSNLRLWVLESNVLPTVLRGRGHPGHIAQPIWCARGPGFDTLSGHFLSWRSFLPLLQIPRTDSAANIVCDLRARGPGLNTWSLHFLSWRLILPLLLIPRPYSQAGMVSDSRARRSRARYPASPGTYFARPGQLDWSIYIYQLCQ